MRSNGSGATRSHAQRSEHGEDGEHPPFDRSEHVVMLFASGGRSCARSALRIDPGASARKNPTALSPASSSSARAWASPSPATVDKREARPRFPYSRLCNSHMVVIPEVLHVTWISRRFPNTAARLSPSPSARAGRPPVPFYSGTAYSGEGRGISGSGSWPAMPRVAPQRRQSPLVERYIHRRDLPKQLSQLERPEGRPVLARWPHPFASRTITSE